MILKIFLLYFKVDFRNYFQSKWVLVGQLLGIYLNLLIYWYTSKIIGSSFESTLGLYKMNYFDYLLIGDIILQSSMSAIESNLSHFFMLKVNGMGEYLKTTRMGILKLFMIRSASIFPRDFFFILTYFFMGKLFFDFSLSLQSFMIGVLLQVLALPSFIGMSLGILGFFSSFGRGLGVIGFINTIAGIISGGYFPVEVLPEFIQNYALYLTPYNSLLFGYRRFLVSPTLLQFFEVMGVIMMWNLVLFSIGFFVYKVFEKVELKQENKFIFEK